jgi:hypothetical protein
VTTDGGLRPLFKKHIPEGDWVSVETWSTGRGVPDLNYCINGHEGWIELKTTEGWAVTVRPEQVAWIERRLRAGGRVFLAVRRKRHELWLLAGEDARALMLHGLKALNPLYRSDMEGPSRWNWSLISKILQT